MTIKEKLKELAKHFNQEHIVARPVDDDEDEDSEESEPLTMNSDASRVRFLVKCPRTGARYDLDAMEYPATRYYPTVNGEPYVIECEEPMNTIEDFAAYIHKLHPDLAPPTAAEVLQAVGTLIGQLAEMKGVEFCTPLMEVFTETAGKI